MKPRLIARLDLLAELGEAKWLQEIARATKALDQATRQRQLLLAYREKLRQSWRSGGMVEAGAAKRAADFVAASQKAELQIEQMERQATHQLDLARQGFAATQERRRGLDTARRAAAVDAERVTAQRLERAQTIAPQRPLMPGRRGLLPPTGDGSRR
jgi:flagellar biosynthesis chaperone FliJ